MLSGSINKYFQKLDKSWTFNAAKVGHISALHASNTVYRTTKNLLKPLLQLGFCAIIGTTQKRNRKINGSEFYTLFKLFEMIYPSAGGGFTSSLITIKEASTICGISISKIERDTRSGTYPPKIKLDQTNKGSAVRFFLFQIEEWLKGKRGDWNKVALGV